MTSPLRDTIVVGLDGSIVSERALAWAEDEARRTGRHLLLVHAWHWSTDALAAPMTLVGTPDALRAGQAILDRAVAKAHKNGVSARGKLLEGSPSSVLVHAADGASMLVVGSHGHGKLANVFLGSVSRACIAQATCPVVVMPAERHLHSSSQVETDSHVREAHQHA